MVFKASDVQLICDQVRLYRGIFGGEEETAERGDMLQLFTVVQALMMGEEEWDAYTDSASEASAQSKAKGKGQDKGSNSTAGFSVDGGEDHESSAVAAGAAGGKSLPLLGRAFHEVDSELGELVSEALLSVCCYCLRQYPCTNAHADSGSESESGNSNGNGNGSGVSAYRRQCAEKVR